MRSLEKSRNTLVTALVLFSLSFSLFTSAHPIAAQEPTFDLEFVTPDSPLADHSFNPYPLIDEHQALGITPGSESRAAQWATPPGINSDDFARQGTPPQKPSNVVPLELNGLSGTPIGTPQERSTAPQTTPGCQYMLYNPGMDYGSGWYSYFPNVYYSSSAYYNPPHSLRMIEDFDGVPETGTDYDGFGQPFYFPATAHSLLLEFTIAYGGWGNSDAVGWGFYYVNPDGTLGNYIEGAYGGITKYADNQWHAEQISSETTISPDAIAAMQGQEIALVFFTNTGDDGYTLDVYIDNVFLKLCTPSTVPTGSISGSLSETGSSDALNNSFIFLTYTPAGGQMETVDLTFPDWDGNYVFENVGPLSPGDQYQVWYLNDGSDPDRLSAWVGPVVNSFYDGQYLTGMDFEVKNVELLAPEHDANMPFPVTFSWGDRGLSGYRYHYCIYDTHTLDTVCTVDALSGTSIEIEASDLQNIPNSDFTLVYGRRYGWYVVVVGPTYDGATFADLGYSYYAHAVTFTTSATTPPDNPPPPEGDPPTDTGGADWTVMLYIAGDNNLGDTNRYPNPTANLQGQFNTLKQLSSQYPQVNLVTLTDFYDDSGTQFCHLKPDGPPDCQQMGEQDTSDPAVLANFVSNALDNFPANHTMLVISNHGHAITGVAVDETTSRSAQMTPEKIRQAFETAALNTRKLDILFYNVCLMGNMAAAFDASPFADYMVASANEVWVLSVYERLLPLLSGAATKDDPRAVAAGIVDAYKASVNASAPGFFISSAAFDLSKVPSINTALSNLATTLSDSLSNGTFSRDVLRNDIRAATQVYDSSGDILLQTDEDAFVDLWHLVTLLSNQTLTGNSQVSTAASNVLNALGPVGGASSLVIASQQVTGGNGSGGTHNLGNATGLSVFFPNESENKKGYQEELTDLYLTRAYPDYAEQTQWDEFIRLYRYGSLSSGPASIRSGPASIRSGTRPVGGSLPEMEIIYLPVVFR